MAANADGGWPTLETVASRMDPDGRIADVAELLNQDLDWLDDIPWVQCNKETGHLLSERTALPSSANLWRSYNQGVGHAKSRTAHFTEVTGTMEQYCIVDKTLAEDSGDVDGFRASEAKPVVEILSQGLATAVWYQSVLTDPEKIHGLTPRYPATSGYTSSSYVIGQGTRGGSNCHSIWLLTWDLDTIFGIYPKASTAGLSVRDLGESTFTKSDGTELQVLREHFQWRPGIAVRDYRYAVRFQWDPDDANNSDDDKTLYLGLQQMLDTIKKVTPHTRFYMDRTSKSKLDAQLLSNEGSPLKYIEQGGRQVLNYMGVTVRMIDSLVGEDAIS